MATLTKVKKIKLSEPIIIGERALELYKLVVPSDDAFSYIVTAQDFDTLKEQFKDVKVYPWAVYTVDGFGTHYYLSWYHYSYDTAKPDTKKIKNKLVINKDVLLMMSLLPAFDKYNKIPKATVKRNLEHISVIVNSCVQLPPIKE